MLKAAIALLSVCACASWAPGAETVRLPLMQEPARAVSAVSEFVFALPRHINVQAGSEVRLMVHFRTPPGATPDALVILANGRELQPRFSAETTSLALQIEAQVPETILQSGWNRIVAVLPRQFGTCEVRRAESYLSLNFDRVALFPELRRFPESILEEKLLQPELRAPSVSILLPARRRDVHLRGCAILAARFGQQSYFNDSDFELAAIESWPSVENRNAVIVGRADELGNLPMLAGLAEKLSTLADGRGLLAEFILGDFPNQRRWILATGGDDAGVEKALLTLGHQPALNVLPPSPVEIANAPAIEPQLETLTKPSQSRPTFKDLGWRDFELGAAPEHRFGWRLPPGYMLEWGELTLNFFHPREISHGSVEVFLGPSRVGTFILTPENAEGGKVTLSLPEGFSGIDPAMFTFRASSTNLLPHQSIATVLANSHLETIVNPIPVGGLQHINTVLMRDPFLRRTAFLLSATPSLAETKLVADLAMNLGRQLPTSPILWPHACTFDTDRRPRPECVDGRTALLLGPVSLWHAAAPDKARLLIRQVERDTVRIQGRRSKIADYDASLTLMQMTPAPWASEEWLITVGGWQDLDTAIAKRLIVDGATEGWVYGNMAATDGKGRFAAYDSRRASVESFPQRLKAHIPAGLTAEQTAAHQGAAATRREQSLFVNRFLIWFIGIFIGAIVLGRLLLVWERRRHYQTTVQSENRLGTP